MTRDHYLPQWLTLYANSFPPDEKAERQRGPRTRGMSAERERAIRTIHRFVTAEEAAANRDRRRPAPLSQRQMAEHAGVHHATLARAVIGLVQIGVLTATPVRGPRDSGRLRFVYRSVWPPAPPTADELNERRAPVVVALPEEAMVAAQGVAARS